MNAIVRKTTDGDVEKEFEQVEILVRNRTFAICQPNKG